VKLSGHWLPFKRRVSARTFDAWHPRYPLDQTVKAVHEWFLTLPRELMLQASGLASANEIEPEDRDLRIDSGNLGARLASTIQVENVRTMTYKSGPRQ
jgi:hypothetical protein